MRITAAEFITSCARLADWPAPAGPEIAVVGRSNVGKSSLINQLLHQPGLAHVSRTPGKTRLINFFQVTARAGAPLTFHLVDLPGYGYAAVAKTLQKQWAGAIEDYLTQRPTIAAVLALVDARRGSGDLDLLLQRWLRARALRTVYIATKIDLIPRGQRRSVLGAMAASLEVAPETIVEWSSRNGEGQARLLAELQAILTQGT